MSGWERWLGESAKYQHDRHWERSWSNCHSDGHSEGATPHNWQHLCFAVLLRPTANDASPPLSLWYLLGITESTACLALAQVVSVARDLFGCATLTGAELENQPTASGGCFGAHWEKRLMANELMAATTSHVARYSALTLAALEDSGWYRANYSMADPVLWGRLEGCDFIDKKCVENGVALATSEPTFCIDTAPG